MADRLTSEQREQIRLLLLKSLAAHAAVYPDIKEMLEGKTLDIQIIEYRPGTAVTTAEELFKKPVDVRRVRLNVHPLPQGSGKFTHYILATLPDGSKIDVSQHKSFGSADRQKRKLERLGPALDGYVKALGGGSTDEVERPHDG